MALRRNSLPHSLTSPGRDTLIENSSVSESRLYSRQKKLNLKFLSSIRLSSALRFAAC